MVLVQIWQRGSLIMVLFLHSSISANKYIYSMVIQKYCVAVNTDAHCNYISQNNTNQRSFRSLCPHQKCLYILHCMCMCIQVTDWCTHGNLHWSRRLFYHHTHLYLQTFVSSINIHSHDADLCMFYSFLYQSYCISYNYRCSCQSNSHTRHILHCSHLLLPNIHFCLKQSFNDEKYDE